MKEKQKMESLPLGFYNMLKGLGMILVIYGHSANLVGQSGKLSDFFTVLGAGVMAMFFIISGYGFVRRKPKKYIKASAKDFLKPYAIVGALVVLSKLGLAFVRHRSFYEHGFEYVPTYLLGLNASGGGEFMGIPIQSIGIFWFVLALFTGGIILNFILGIGDEKKQMAVVAAVVIAGYLLTLITKIWVFVLPIGLISTGYLYFGYLTKKYNLMMKTLKWYVWLAIIAISCLFLCFSWMNIACVDFRFGFFDVIGIGVIGFLLIRIYMVVRPTLGSNLIVKSLETIGFYSFWIICVHAYEAIIFPWYRIRALISNDILMILVVFVVRSIVIAFGVWGILFIKKHMKKKKKKVKLEL